MKRLKNWLMILVCGPALVLVVSVIISFERDKSKDMILFDNLLPERVQVRVDGQVLGELEASGTYGAAKLMKLPAGAKHVQVTTTQRQISEVTLQIRPRGEDENGYRALYTVGPPQDYVLATVPYFAHDEDVNESPTLMRLERPAPLAELPRALESYEISDIDGPFLDSIKIPKGVKVVHEIQLCRLKEGKVGCDGFPLSGAAPVTSIKE